MLTVETKKILTVDVEDDDPRVNELPTVFYTGDDAHEAEEVEGFLEMCIEIVEAIGNNEPIGPEHSLNRESGYMYNLRMITEILETNGHAPDAFGNV